MDQQYLTDISYRHFIEGVKDYAIYMLDLKGLVISWNKGAQSAKGYSNDEIIGQYYGVFYSLEEQNLHIPSKNLNYAKEHGHFEGEGWRYKKNGDRFWAHVVIDSIYSDTGVLEGFAKITKDITEQKAFLDKISYLARYDNVTDLPNRHEFFSIVNKKLNDQPHQKLAIFMLGINNLKEIIDNRGYQTSDNLLKLISEKIKSCLNTDEVAARFGNDQFVALKVFDNTIHVTDFHKRIHACFEKSFTIDYRELLINVGIGISFYPENANNINELINNADTAMLRACKKIEDRVCFYDKEIDGKNQEIKMIAHDILEAIENKEFFLLYQKKHSLKTNATSGYEALLRWKHPKLGLIPPDLFIPIAEDTGKIIPLGYWVLENMCQEALKHKVGKKISVNLSPIQLKDPHFIQKTIEILERTHYPFSLLELEITETAFMNDKEKSFNLLRELQILGISISLDDFGTGYSSLRLLHDFNFDCIKLDRSFIRDIEHNEKSITFLRSIIALIKAIDVPLIAEGVENNTQLTILKEHGCNEIQGFIFGKPAPLDD